MTTDLHEPAAFDATHPVNDRYTPVESAELAALAELFDGGTLSGGAPEVEAYENALRDFFDVGYAVAVNSGSSALPTALVALGIGPGTEVIVPAVAPIPTAMPILTCGATPVIVDVLPGSLALDPDDVSGILTARTKAAITVPLWGYPTDDTDARALLTDAGVPVVEDAAQAHGTITGGRYAGTTGTIGCFSTHDRKLLSTGEGGFVLTDRADLYERIEHYTRLGHLRGNTHGVNYKLAGPLAAIGLLRLARLPEQLATRHANAHQILDQLPEGGRLTELTYPNGDQPNYYNLVLTTDGPGTQVAHRFADAGLPPDSIRYGYRPLYQQPLFAPYARPCPNAEHLATTTIQLPVHPGLHAAALRWIAECVAAIAQRESESP
ncbi:DegT/DnrJ/EryC1/StrS aminotransferase family protein [Phytohabitans flavus]|uniref:Glutamine--scyllo-inositol aminotransferase n=1 Tax=Phytohabitans flavus TaxID=1076124 RepID=A0A6F8Y522_9ACTN|nr:DegT/DnrJ/EryC1/StrS family aminotransferase [Phytohabitans flavus]BCB81212.1 glutamine--scyllo-inositol aminotransferase [Phytohabitans flavus]